MSDQKMMTPAEERERTRRLREQWRQRHYDLALAVLGESETRRAQQVASAFYGLLADAKNPHDVMATTEESRIAAIRAMADLDLYPGGAAPSCWLIPQRTRGVWQVQLWLSHRGWAILGARDGCAIVTCPVHVEDELETEDGIVTLHRADPARGEIRWSDLAGVTVRVMREGLPALRLWTPRHVIEAARAAAKQDHVWSAHPVAMAQKTAIKYHATRGHIPMDSGAWQRAHEVEMAAIEVEARAEITRPGTRQIPDYTTGAAPSEVVEPEYVPASPGEEEA